MKNNAIKRKVSNATAHQTRLVAAGGLLLALGMATTPALAVELACGPSTTPNLDANSSVNCFIPDNIAKSGEVNANFEYLLQQNMLLQQRLIALEEKLATVTYNASTKNLRITGANLQIVNGQGRTDFINGKGNLIIGYNKAATREICNGAPGNPWDLCADFGTNHRQGSHNVVIGDKHQYSKHSGLVVGYDNAIVGVVASITGGRSNSVGDYGNISGGRDNITRGEYASISGGRDNYAGRAYTSVSGGRDNRASGDYASISGGGENTASGAYASVNGGRGNWAGDWPAGSGILEEDGRYTSVSGGRNNHASGNYATVSGGGGDSAANDANRARGKYSTVSGGNNNIDTTLWGHTP